MSINRTLASVLAVGALSVGMATGAAAAVQTYTVTSDHCSGGCLPDTSTITATDSGSNLDISVTLAPGDQFMHGPTGDGKSTFGFDFTLSSFTISGLVAPWETNLNSNTNVTFSSRAFSMDGAGNYDYVIDYTPGSGGPSGVSSLSFVIANASTADIPNVSGVFAADILSASTDNTGVVDFSLSSTVPEPATWAMMALGFFGLGLAGYRKTRSARTAFAA